MENNVRNVVEAKLEVLDSLYDFCKSHWDKKESLSEDINHGRGITWAYAKGSVSAYKNIANYIETMKTLIKADAYDEEKESKYGRMGEEVTPGVYIKCDSSSPEELLKNIMEAYPTPDLEAELLEGIKAYRNSTYLS